MDSQTALINAGISAGMYILYKIAQRYYIRSGCHDSTIEITIIDKEKKEEKRDTEKKEELEVVAQALEHP